MNPGNGIETSPYGRCCNGNRCFLFMNPGNGIETSADDGLNIRLLKVSYL